MRLDRPKLLHGDFSDQNLIRSSDGLRIVDFDECGLGPIEYDLANSLYMVSFDADRTGRPERLERFRHPFLEGYAATAGRPVSEDVMATAERSETFDGCPVALLPGRHVVEIAS